MKKAEKQNLTEEEVCGCVPLRGNDEQNDEVVNSSTDPVDTDIPGDTEHLLRHIEPQRPFDNDAINIIHDNYGGDSSYCFDPNHGLHDTRSAYFED